MITLAKIKGDAKGNFVGKLLKDSLKGTPKQIGNAIVGNLKIIRRVPKKRTTSSTGKSSS
jgi:hypothetical protein